MARKYLSKAFSKYGASIGRRETHDNANNDVAFKFSLVRIEINQGGYDRGGAYWGTGQPLYQAEAFEESVPDHCERPCFYVRADTREAAKNHVRYRYPNARFYR